MKERKKFLMTGKATAVLTIVFFIVFTFSCQSLKPKKVETTSFKKGKVVKVYQLQKKSGIRIKFLKSDPALIVDENDSVHMVWVDDYDGDWDVWYLIL